MLTPATKYPKARRSVSGYPYQLLKHPKPDNKVGQFVTRGEFKGYRIHTLTLEERATCPRSCDQWVDCYGNNMPFAHRLEHGADLERRLRDEVSELCRKYPNGVMVRLHVLGDFYSVRYVKLWGQLLRDHPNLAAWGYTHRKTSGTKRDASIARALYMLGNRYGSRWSIRISDEPDAIFSANHETLGAAGITCPEQLGRSQSCGTCTLCWAAPEKRINFLHH